jgi:hypothetical protein
MATITEGRWAGEFLVNEANGSLSRETILVAANQTLGAGRILGQITLGTITGAPGTNTGNGTIGTLTRTSRAVAGVYVARCVAAATNGGRFEVIDPNGKKMADALVGVAYSNGEIGFTIADGATDFVVGDTFNITVAAGSGQYVPVAPAATDGSSIASAILFSPTVTPAGGPGEAVVVVRDAEVNRSALDFGSLDSNQQTAAIAQLASRNIIVREAVS